ncbi:MAG TPA: class I SAM-dependent methyltransferase [Thermodesulfovibrionales bacterium]|nr:class I SAM-dependent methyltransferase [Thermodesulfovibrionales bacterium]
MTIGQAFDASVPYYDDWIRKALPGYEDMFSAALGAIPFDHDNPLSVLDLGAGTGLFSYQVFLRFPRATFVLCDVAEKMLDIARQRFKVQGKQFEYAVKDYRDIEGEGIYDLVISSMSIHHLADHEKKALFCKVFAILRQPGVFINVDQIKGATPHLEQLYWRWWLAKIRIAGASEEQIRAGVERRHAYDKDACMEDQLLWLRDAGFETVDCVYKNYSMGVFFAMRGFPAKAEGKAVGNDMS